MTRRRAWLALLLMLPATIGCGDQRRLDTGAIEQDIKRGLQRQTRIEIPAVTCPNEVKPRRGATFTCTATYVRGRKATVQVRQTDAKGNVTWRLTGGSVTGG